MKTTVTQTLHSPYSTVGGLGNTEADLRSAVDAESTVDDNRSTVGNVISTVAGIRSTVVELSSFSDEPSQKLLNSMRYLNKTN